MNIKIVCVGKLKEKYFKDGIAEYVKRMSRFAKVKIVQVPDEKAPEKPLRSVALKWNRSKKSREKEF